MFTEVGVRPPYNIRVSTRSLSVYPRVQRVNEESTAPGPSVQGLHRAGIASSRAENDTGTERARTVESKTCWNGCEILLHQGDITELTIDAIVNAANSELWAGDGVCGAIHRRAGRALAEECSLIISRSGEVPEGQAVITTGGALPARHVIHAVGPFYDDDPARAPERLASAYRQSLRLAREHGLRSIAFPCIGTGAFGYPPDEACRVALDAVRADLELHNRMDKVIFCVFVRSDLDLYERALSQN
jgi:O-acetyl-ADP-ribose deacetylase (regulator of RNase III)